MPSEIIASSGRRGNARIVAIRSQYGLLKSLCQALKHVCRIGEQSHDILEDLDHYPRKTPRGKDLQGLSPVNGAIIHFGLKP